MHALAVAVAVAVREVRCARRGPCALARCARQWDVHSRGAAFVGTAGPAGNCEPCLPGPADEPRPTPHVPVPVMSAVSRPPGLGISIRIYVKAKATAHPYHRHYRPLPSPAARSNRVLPSHPVGFLHLFLFQRRLYVPSLSGGPLSYKA